MTALEIAMAGYLAFGQPTGNYYEAVTKHSGLQVIHADGAVTLRLWEQGTGNGERIVENGDGSKTTVIRLRDEHYPFEVTRYVRTWDDCAAVETWAEIRHEEVGAVRLVRADSFAALPLGAAELTHRWSFNGDWADSAGGAQSSATACGTYVSLYGNRVHMGYGGCSHGTGYVNLGTNMLDTTAATIEIWARHDGVQNWSRVFDYGADNAHYFTLCWTYGTNLNNDRAGMKNPGEIAVDGTMAPYEIGVDYHIAGTDR